MCILVISHYSVLHGEETAVKTIAKRTKETRKFEAFDAPSDEAMEGLKIAFYFETANRQAAWRKEENLKALEVMTCEFDRAKSERRMSS